MRNIFEKTREEVHMIYSNVKTLCDEKGITVSQLERDLGFPRSSICKWNENEPGVMRVQKVADYFGVPIERVVEGHKQIEASASAAVGG